MLALYAAIAQLCNKQTSIFTIRSQLRNSNDCDTIRTRYIRFEKGFDVGFYDILKRIADDEGVPLTSIGPKIGKGPSYVNGGATRGSDPSTSNAAAMLSACGWTLAAIRPTRYRPTR